MKEHLSCQGRLTDEQILQAEDYALTMKMPLDEAALFLNFLDYESLGQILADIFGTPYQALLQTPPPESAKEKVPVKIAERHHIFPVNFDEKTHILTLAVHDPSDPELLEKLGNFFPAPFRLDFVVASRPEIAMAIDVHYRGKTYTASPELEIPEEFTIVSSENSVGSGADPEEVRISDQRILVLEPALDRFRALSAILRMEGFPDVRWVASPEEASNAVKTEPFDVILVNARSYRARGSWIRDMAAEMDLPPVSYYDLKSMLLAQVFPYGQMSEALISLVSFFVSTTLKDREDQLRETVVRVRYCKALAIKLGMDPVRVDGTILAAWLCGLEQADRLPAQVVTPYGLEEIVGPTVAEGKGKRLEASVLSLVRKYQDLKKSDPELAGDMDRIRKRLGPQLQSSEEKTVLECLIHVIRDEAFLKDAGKSAGRVLVVDPEYSVDSGMALRLANEGYDVTGVPDAAKAAKVVMDSGTDLVISEVNLPGTDGLKLCRALRKSSRAAHTPFFFVSAEEGERLAAECLEAGADDFLKKPVDLELLSLKIRHILSIKGPGNGNRGITGSLVDMSATDIVQSLTSGDKNVEVRLESMGKRGRIYIREGEIIHSEAGELEGEEAFYRIMGWQSGKFEVVGCSTFPDRTIHSSTMSLLMEGARLTDEASHATEA